MDSLEVDGLTLENRIVFPPMQTKLASEEGEVTEPLIEHYKERAKGNGLMIVEHSYVSTKGRYAKKQLGIHRDDLVTGLTELVDTIHERGTPVAIQLNHCGGKTDYARDDTPVAPSPNGNTRMLEKDEMLKIVEDFVEAARRAVEAGFDAVEIHGAHGFLLNQFYSPLTNLRDDRYGGSFENRVRFPLQVVREVRKAVKDLPLFYRLGSTDLDPKGVQIKDSKRYAKMLTESGIDLIDVSGGYCGDRPDELKGKQGFFVPQAYEIGEAVKVPVIGVGGITDPDYADKIVRDGKVDLVAVGRAQFSDEDWAVKAVEKLRVKK